MSLFRKSILLILLFVSSCSLAQIEKQDAINYLKSNLGFLSDDLLNGREAGSHDEKVASLFIASELKKYGVRPFGDNGTYFHNFDLTVRSINPSTTIVLKSGNGITTLKYVDDFLIYKRTFPDFSNSDKDANVVFVKYGITDDALGYDDYKNLDVNGKIVLMYGDLPSIEKPNAFSDSKYSRYNLGETKRNIAAEHGAVAVIYVPGPSQSRTWGFLERSALTPNYDLKELPKDGILPTIYLSENGFEKLMAGESVSAKELIENQGEDTPKYFKLTKTLHLISVVDSEIKPARNVVGILEGNDASLRSEYVGIGSHYDHLGTRGDDVYNGADDNGSGTVAVLEVARELAAQKTNKRSILFIFHTAEEKGVYGSKILTHQMPWIKNISAYVNMDMVGRETVDSIYCIGSGKLSAEFHQLVLDANKNNKYFIYDFKFDDPNDPNRYYYRSDHLYYAMEHVPIVFFFDEMQIDYHQPSDTIEKINFEKIYKTSRLSKDLVLLVANLDHKVVVDKEFE